jgi:hypothetical protein
MEETGRTAGEQEDVGDQEKKKRDQTLALFCSWRHVLVHRLDASAVLGAFFYFCCISTIHFILLSERLRWSQLQKMLLCSYENKFRGSQSPGKGH